MKPIRCLVLALFATGSVHAGWNDLRPGMDVIAARECVGAPLLQSSGRATQQWSFDLGGYILFERGRVAYWAAPKEPAQTKPNAVLAKSPRQPATPGTAAKTPKPAAKPQVVASTW